MGYAELLGATDMMGRHKGGHEQDRRDQYLPLNQLGFNTSVATQTATIQPQVTFRIDRYVVGNSIAPSFLLNTHFIGNHLQSVSTGSISCEVFSNLSVGVRMKLDTAVVGVVIAANLTYIGTVTSTGTVGFYSAFIGPAVY